MRAAAPRRVRARRRYGIHCSSPRSPRSMPPGRRTAPRRGPAPPALRRPGSRRRRPRPARPRGPACGSPARPGRPSAPAASVRRPAPPRRTPSPPARPDSAASAARSRSAPRPADGRRRPSRSWCGGPPGGSGPGSSAPRRPSRGSGCPCPRWRGGGWWRTWPPPAGRTRSRGSRCRPSSPGARACTEPGRAPSGRSCCHTRRNGRSSSRRQVPRPATGARSAGPGPGCRAGIRTPSPATPTRPGPWRSARRAPHPSRRGA